MKPMYMQPVNQNERGEYHIACGTIGLRRLDGRLNDLELSAFDKRVAVGFVVAQLDTPLRGRPLVADVDFVLVKD